MPLCKHGFYGKCPETESDREASDREAVLRFVSDITLRNLFAAAALAGMASYYASNVPRVAVMAYKYADAMLQAREATP